MCIYNYQFIPHVDLFIEYLEAHSTGGAPPTDANATPNAPGTVTE